MTSKKSKFQSALSMLSLLMRLKIMDEQSWWDFDESDYIRNIELVTQWNVR